MEVHGEDLALYMYYHTLTKVVTLNLVSIAHHDPEWACGLHVEAQ